jgi:ribonuclease P protein component
LLYNQLTGRSFRLSKDELLSGHDAYKQVFRLSSVIESDFLRFNYILSNIEKSPQDCYKVGFSVSKRYVKKAVFRNRIKRMLKEIYRTNKNKDIVQILDKLSYLIISVREKHLRDNTYLLKSGFGAMNKDYMILLGKLNDRIQRI